MEITEESCVALYTQESWLKSVSVRFSGNRRDSGDLIHFLQ